MTGSRVGGLKTRDKILVRNPDHYSKIGKIVSRKTGSKKGYAANPELASRSGTIGGKKSSRRGIPNKNKRS